MVTLLEEIDTAYYKYFIYIDIRNTNNVFIIQEGYMQNYRSIATLLGKNLQNPRRVSMFL